jgi:hypothetical protein
MRVRSISAIDEHLPSGWAWPERAGVGNTVHGCRCPSSHTGSA